MYLIHLDENNTVLACTPAGEGPFLLPLSASHMIGMSPVMVGRVFDPETQTFAVPARKRWITKLAFDSRFTMAEATNLKLAQMLPTRLPDEADADYAVRCAMPAQLQVMAGRLSMATFIDLDRADTRGGVQMLESVGLLAAGRALEILDGEIAVHEYHPDA